VRPVSVPAQALCRRRLPGAGVPQVRQSRAVTSAGGDRQALGSSHGLRRLAQTLGGGKNAGLAEPLPPPGQGLGEPQSQGTGISADGVHPPHGQEAMPGLAMFPDRHLARLYRKMGQASSPALDVKDWFRLKDLVRSVEGEVEPSEVSECAPASPGDGPVEQFEAIGLWDRPQSGDWTFGTRVNKRVTAAGF